MDRVRRVSDKSWPAGKISKFKRVRPKTARAAIIEMAGWRGGAKIDALVEAIGKDRLAVMAHLYDLKRDCAVGFEIRNERITLRFPGTVTWRDAILPTPRAARSSPTAPASLDT